MESAVKNIDENKFVPRVKIGDRVKRKCGYRPGTEYIEDAIGYEFDFSNGTKEEASEYISKHIDEYKKYVNEHYEQIKLQRFGEGLYIND